MEQNYRGENQKNRRLTTALSLAHISSRRGFPTMLKANLKKVTVEGRANAVPTPAPHAPKRDLVRCHGLHG